MPLVLAGFFGALRWFVAANLVGFFVRLLVALGLTVVVVEPAIEAVMGVMSSAFASALDPVVIEWVGFFNLDTYVGIIISAYAIQVAANFVLKFNR